MKDELAISLSYNNFVRIYTVTTTETLNTIGKRLNYYPSALAAVGRVISVGAMMGGMLKKDETITIKVEGNGPIGLILVDANARGDVRAYAGNPHVHFQYQDTQKLNVRATVGEQGFISIIKDLKLKEPFIGTVPIVSGELAQDFAYYFSASEQIPSAVSLGVLVNDDNSALYSGGFIAQLLPDAPDDTIDILEKKIAELPPISQLLASGKSPLDLATMIGDDTTITIAKYPVQFKCNCNRERSRSAILALGMDEIEDILTKDKVATTICHFCGNEYRFNEKDLEGLLKVAKKSL